MHSFDVAWQVVSPANFHSFLPSQANWLLALGFCLLSTQFTVNSSLVPTVEKNVFPDLNQASALKVAEQAGALIIFQSHRQIAQIFPFSLRSYCADK